MKKLKPLFIVIIMSIFALALIGCNRPHLSKPMRLVVDDIRTEISWYPVVSASGYVIEINGKSYEIKRNKYDISKLGTGTYEVRVKAQGDGMKSGDSAWATLSFEKYDDYGLVFKAINSSTEYEVVSIGEAEGDVVIPRQYNGKNVTRIATGAFSDVYSMFTLTMPDTITEIEEKAFINCQSVTSIKFSESLLAIGANAFQSCPELNNVVLPDSLVTIGDFAFSECQGLSSITFGNGLKTIGKSAFYNCPALVDVTLSDSVQTLDNSAFASCKALKTFNTGNGLKTINTGVFRSCEVLENVTLGRGLETIGESAFIGCKLLKKIVIPDNVKTIGESAFYNCESLADVKIGSGVQKIGRLAFEGEVTTNSDGTVLSDKRTMLFKYPDPAHPENPGTPGNPNDDIVYADKWVIGLRNKDYYSAANSFTTEQNNPKFKSDTEGIADYAFNSPSWENPNDPDGLALRYTFRSFEFPDTVKYIGLYAFRNCANIETLTFGRNLQEIGERAFEGCSILATLNFSTSSTLKTIGNYAFMDCARLDDSFVIPSSVTRVGSYAFARTKAWVDSYNRGQTIVYMGGWVQGVLFDDYNDPEYEVAQSNNGKTTVGLSDFSFMQLRYVTGVKLPDTLKYIGKYSFVQCDLLEKVNVPSGVTEIREGTFRQCPVLTTVNLPNTVVEIGRQSFYKCEGLTDMDIPDSVTTIGEHAFYGDEMLTNVTFSDNSKLTSLGNRAFYRSGIHEINIPSGIDDIGDYAFYDCTQLQTVKIGSGVQRIGKYAFSNCTSLRNVTIADNVKTIDNYAFRNCRLLENIDLGNGVQRINKGAFANCDGLNNVVLPASLTELGAQAFRGCSSLESVVISDTLTTVDMHVFYGCSQLTIYTDMKEIPASWHVRWNTSYRPVVFDMQLSDDKSYVKSFTKNGGYIFYMNGRNYLSSPTRKGYDFKGWALSQEAADRGEVEFPASLITEVADGTTLYACWAANN